MNNWKLLDQKEYDEVWDKFHSKFVFKPSIDNFPSIQTDLPQLKFSTKNGYSASWSSEELEKIALGLFLKISNPGDRLYALDWQHDSYDFNPREEMDRNEFDEWVIPIFPNGDYYIFLTKDLKNVWFGHPWEKSITLIGNDLVKFATEEIISFEKSEMLPFKL